MRHARIGWILVLPALSTVIGLVSLIWTQLVLHEHYDRAARRESLRKVPLRSRRGMILDSRGRVVVRDEPAASLWLDYVIPACIDETAHVFPQYAQHVRTMAARNRAGWIARKQQMPPNTKLPCGVYRLDDFARGYPFGTTGSHILGVVGVDGAGLTGIEHEYDAILTGREGWMLLGRTAARQTFVPTNYVAHRPVDGEAVRLHVDFDLQLFTDTVADELCGRRTACRAAVLVLSSHGETLALASAPRFDPRAFRSAPRGSVDANCALQCLIPVPAIVELGRAAALFDVSAGDPTIAQRAAVSALAALHTYRGTTQGRERLADPVTMNYVRAMGLLARTGIDLPGEARGEAVPADAGVRIRATPIGIAKAFATIGSGGASPTPRVRAAPAPARPRALTRPVATYLQRLLQTNARAHDRTIAVEGADVAAASWRALDESGTSHFVVAGVLPFATDEARIIVLTVSTTLDSSMDAEIAAAFRRITIAVLGGRD